MITFYPGPSKVYEQVPQYVREAYAEGILSINHRSAEFVEISRQTIRLVKEKLAVPDDYTVFYASSATECWEMISQSLVRQRSYHVYNGAFGEKWFRYAQRLQPEASDHPFDPQTALDVSALTPPSGTEVMALTHNETSNGTAIHPAILRDIRQRFPEVTLAVDATSSLAGVALPIDQADVWYASVQKCFGLPAGLAVMICSPRALAQAQRVGERAHYNSLLYMQEQMQRWQTTHTPNVLGIYLLMRTLSARAEIETIDKQTHHRHQAWVNHLSSLPYLELLIRDPAVRSRTVTPVRADARIINQLRRAAQAAGITLGKGYGALKETTLRIANFPAITDAEIASLQQFLRDFA